MFCLSPKEKDQRKMELLKSHASIWIALATEFAIDNKSLQRFNMSQSLEFYHVHMPHLGKDLDRGLSTGFFELTAPFKRASAKSVLPAFLNEFFYKIFDRDGWIRQKPCKIRELRQLLMMFYKFEMPADSEMKRKATLKFLVTDALVKTGDWPEDIGRVRDNFTSILPVSPTDVRPHHSNGATYDKVDNVERRVARKNYVQLYSTFGLDMFFLTSNKARKVLEGERPCTPVSRVTFVPKDSRGPRTICIEPHELMMVQKGLMQLLYDHIENDSPAMGQINFTDQSINRRLAQLGSYNGYYATIDLKDASDRVSLSLIEELAPPEWLYALKACRSQFARCNGFNVELKKFAPMGSALCFPIEAMVFWSIARTVTNEVWVFGDDIIVPAKTALAVMERLESYGLVINRDKSFVYGSFKESCGGFYYHGADISYVKITSYDLVPFVATLNLLSDAYGTQVTDLMISDYEARTRQIVRRKHVSYRANPEPLVYYTERLSSMHWAFKSRYNSDLQRHEYHVPLLVTKARDSNIPVESTEDFDDFLYLDWLCSNFQANQPKEFHSYRHNFSHLEEFFTPPKASNYSTSLRSVRTPLIVDRKLACALTQHAWAPME